MNRQDKIAEERKRKKEKYLGKVVCDQETPNSTEFKFQVGQNPPRIRPNDFVIVKDKELIGKVAKVYSYNEYFESPKMVEDSMQRGYDLKRETPSGSGWTQAEVKILGERKDTQYEFTGRHPEPGEKVHKLPPSLLREILNFRRKGILLGTLTQFPKVRARLDTGVFTTEHSHTVGVTRWGKSYTNAVLIEELFKKGYSILVVDPHGEYRSFQEPNDKGEEVSSLPKDLEPRGFETTVFAPSGFTRGEEEELRVGFSELRPSEIIEITKTSGENQIAVIRETYNRLRGREYDVSDFIAGMEETKQAMEISAATSSVAARLMVFQRDVGVFGKGLEPTDVIEKGKISVLNLSGVGVRTQRIITTCILRRLFSERMRKNIPKFSLFVDEAQRFVPQGINPISKGVIEEYIKEGLKFGVNVHLISQRATEISTTARSQTGTKIFHKLTEKSELNYASNLIGEEMANARDLLRRLSKGEAIVVGGATNYIPVRVNIRPRQSKHIGKEEIKGVERNKEQEAKGRERHETIESPDLTHYNTHVKNSFPIKEGEKIRIEITDWLASKKGTKGKLKGVVTQITEDAIQLDNEKWFPKSQMKNIEKFDDM